MKNEKTSIRYEDKIVVTQNVETRNAINSTYLENGWNIVQIIPIGVEPGCYVWIRKEIKDESTN